MTTKWIDFKQVPQLSYKDVAYTVEKPEIMPFYNFRPGIESFKQAIEERQKHNVNRKLLVEILDEQYATFSKSIAVNRNIQLLKQVNTFTIITAHQPSLFTGPLYYIYKIISTIHLCKKLAAQYPDYQFVPVFVTGGEDHDFEEVNYIHLFGKKLVWENEQKGSVGMMSTQSLEPVLEELKELVGNSELGKEIFQVIQSAYTQNKIYSKATIQLVHELFKEFGLVVFNMNHKDLKKGFIPIIKEEMFNRPSKALVQATADELLKINFKPQAYPRDINFFYIRKNLRERIVLEDNLYKVLNTDLAFTQEEMAQEIEQYPERFSPNVVMRPLFQQHTLPNLAYIGGGGEIAYWLERKTQFEHFGVFFPMLIRRNSVLWIDKSNYKKIKKLGLQTDELFSDADSVIRNYVERQSTQTLEISQEKEIIRKSFEQIAEKGKKIDPTLEKAILAEQTKQMKLLDQLESRLVRSEKQKHETALKQIRSLKEKLFPGNGLQERHDNLLGFYLKYGRRFFDVLLEHLDPLKKQFLVIVDE